VDYARRHGEVEAGEYVAISVSDTGIGMPPDVADRAFDPFFTTKPIGQGTGLGLSMIYGFAKQSRGHLRISSEEGLGTTIRLYLARAHTDLDIPSIIEAVEMPRGEGETILVVEDDAAVRLLITAVLEELGYRYLEASDAPQAMTILRSGARIDLLLTDVGLPVMNGRQLAEFARASRPAIKVLFATGYAENAAVRGDFLDQGMDMLTKPFALNELGLKIREMIGPAP
jgi:CheY-like chemotaxis protein